MEEEESKARQTLSSETWAPAWAEGLQTDTEDTQGADCQERVPIFSTNDFHQFVHTKEKYLSLKYSYTTVRPSGFDKRHVNRPT